MDHFELNKLMHPLPAETDLPISPQATSRPSRVAAAIEPLPEGQDLGPDLTLKPRWTVGGATPAFISKNYQAPPSFGSAKAVNNNRFAVCGFSSPSPFRRTGRSSSVSRVEDSPPPSPPIRVPPFQGQRPKKFIKQSKIEKMLYDTYVTKEGVVVNTIDTSEGKDGTKLSATRKEPQQQQQPPQQQPELQQQTLLQQQTQLQQQSQQRQMR